MLDWETSFVLECMEADAPVLELGVSRVYFFDRDFFVISHAFLPCSVAFIFLWFHITLVVRCAPRAECTAPPPYTRTSRPAAPFPCRLTAQEDVVAYAVREKLGLDLSPAVVVGSRLEEAVKGWRELEELCRACEGLPFLLSVRVRGILPSLLLLG